MLFIIVFVAIAFGTSGRCRFFLLTFATVSDEEVNMDTITCVSVLILWFERRRVVVTAPIGT